MKDQKFPTSKWLVCNTKSKVKFLNSGAEKNCNDLASASTTATGNGKVLSVDGKGDVVLVNDDNSFEKIKELENKVAQLKKQVSELLLVFIATKN